ncbi:MAG: C4-dicarboxylate ABC transporter [Campylobacteraceae bacterium]|jgi:tellurite resistance protein|nr:C4-dicarboxylate ABC transporter [Campylobacteraceae bacterium]MBT3882309.1 C4-dicarboxylate ABC transporter [Campylobacteraceae bacterium]MBT4030225.1 C4-dicarboxylate ABC transporter [Campylobacteraceae bacterium]MBT4178700.1 C4-dicarboxylate ABC transporter [Campylobacteraceae bacterium]MBT4572143.1 C4-dicarboxylate ABC transporter [Campylobacteraceae bacterium]
MIQEENRLKFFPIMMFAIIMGLSGLTITYQKAHEVLASPCILGDLLVYITTGLFFLISAIYLTKWIKYPQAVKKEFSHPIRINFFAAVSISMLLLSIIYKDLNPIVSAFFWYPGMLLHLFLTLNTISFWINHNQELAHSNPAWFIPIVGNVLIPVGGIGFASTGFLTFFFSIGIFFWVILFAIIFNRIIFHQQLAVKFVPTLFILIAPPAIGFVAYIKLFGTLDFFAMFLFNIAIFFTLLIAFMYKSFLGIKFFISWWAFIFPLAAMTIASLLMYKLTNDTAVLYLSYTMIATTTIIIVLVIYQTIKNMLNNEVCIQE